MSLRRSLSNQQHLQVFLGETAELFSAVNAWVPRPSQGNLFSGLACLKSDLGEFGLRPSMHEPYLRSVAMVFILKIFGISWFTAPLMSLTAKTTLAVLVILQCLVLRHHLLDHFFRLVPYPLYNVIVPSVSLLPAALSNVCMFFPTGEATVSHSID